MQALDQHQLLDALGKLLNPPPGEEFSSFVTTALREQLEAKSVIIGELAPGATELQVRAGNPLESLPEKIQLEGVFEALLEGKSGTLTEGQLRGAVAPLSDHKSAITAPLIDPYGQCAGAILVFFDRPLVNKETIAGILSLIAPRIAEEMERKQAEELILQATEEIDHFSTSLKEIHRLNVTDYSSLEALFQDYLQTGCRIFEMDGGILLQKDKESVEIIQKTEVLDDSTEFSKEMEEVISRNSTVTFNADQMQDAGFTFWVGSPVSLKEDTPAVIAFFSRQPGGAPFELFHQEILELMARSISSEAQRRQALKRIQSLKKQQDGDYFLTSLLIRPLNQPDFHSENHKIECIAHQKKTFSFRHWKEELGGDLATAHSLTLQNRPHVALFNADAMGKSMQGAGGALVCGSVFTSIIKRTRKNPVLQKYSPERWLKHAFLELNDVFHSFDSSMLMSVNLALVDESSGTLYYIIAEHPLPVLYRKGKARFLPDPYHYRKLGFQSQQSDIVITIQALCPGDCLIMGSDGRDDIMLPDSAGSSYMNEDENLFLRIVEEVDGDPTDLMEALLARGELTDDLSVLHLKCLAHSVPNLSKLARELHKQSLEAYQLQSYHEAYRHSLEALQLDPSLSDALRVSTFCAKMLGRVRESADLGERLFLRNPDFFPNTIHLSNVHYLLGNLERSRTLLARANQQKPDHPTGRKMKELLRNKEASLSA